MSIIKIVATNNKNPLKGTLNPERQNSLLFAIGL